MCTIAQKAIIAIIPTQPHSLFNIILQTPTLVVLFGVRASPRKTAKQSNFAPRPSLPPPPPAPKTLRRRLTLGSRSDRALTERRRGLISVHIRPPKLLDAAFGLMSTTPRSRHNLNNNLQVISPAGTQNTHIARSSAVIPEKRRVFWLVFGINAWSRARAAMHLIGERARARAPCTYNLLLALSATGAKWIFGECSI